MGWGVVRDDAAAREMARGYCELCPVEPAPVAATASTGSAGPEAARQATRKNPTPSRPGIDASELRVGGPDGDAEEGLGVEGSIKSMPRLAKSRPSDRAARRKALEGRLRVAQEKAAAEAALPIVHGRCCLMGLTVLELIRTAAWWQGTIPGYSVFGMHFLTTTSDIACILCALPLFTTGTQGQCVQLGCLGPMLTLVFAMSLVDISALGAYLVVATPRPLSPGAKSYVDALEACVGVWEWALVASVALQMALCASSWRVYRELRMTGLYPPGSDPAGVGKIREISVMEVMCEAEDVELLADCEVNCETGLKSPLLAYPPATPSTTPAVSRTAEPLATKAAKEAIAESNQAMEEKADAVKCQMRPPLPVKVAQPNTLHDGHGNGGVQERSSAEMPREAFTNSMEHARQCLPTGTGPRSCVDGQSSSRELHGVGLRAAGQTTEEVNSSKRREMSCDARIGHAVAHDVEFGGLNRSSPATTADQVEPTGSTTQRSTVQRENTC